MTARSETSDLAAGSPAEAIESLLAAAEAAGKGADSTAESGEPGVQPHDFRNPQLLSARDLQKLRLHQTEFVNSLASRLSVFLRLEVILRLAGLQTVLYQKLAHGWANPTCLTLFKAEPARGVGILEIAPRLGFAMVDRLMGGPGLPLDSTQEFSEIEKAILEQAVQLILAEWCGHWRGTREFKPSILGHESNGRFVQAAAPETVMLSVAIEVRFGSSTEKINIAFPYAILEPLVRSLSQGAQTNAEPSAAPAAAKTPGGWNSSFDDIRVPLAARWEWSEITARELLATKVGDILRLDPEGNRVLLCVSDLPRFEGRPGVVAGKWAMEVTNATGIQAAS
jgi:flagellar motor switch protein FliM